ncbi:MAG TPA: hypothetical protein VMH02_04140 [Verrucomicrobiae bacterium]|nr:hypothetical protein [Verrucomicrobiae bacterium]
MTGSPLLLAGIVVVIVAILFGIVATIVQTRSEHSYADVPRFDSDAASNEPRDLAVLDALLAQPAQPATASEPVFTQTPPAEPLDRAPEPPPQPEAPPASHRGLWDHLIATEDGPVSVADRLDMVARLEMVGEPWCSDALHAALDEEPDPGVTAAARQALLRLSR